YLYWEKFAKDPNGHEPEELLEEYDRTLSEYVYEKIWYELPETEERIVTLLIRNGRMKNQAIREELDLTDKQMSVYRDRLKRRGIIDVSSYGYLDILLPRFREIASFWTE
ncbi:MAG: winged helix-turn-helix domain-containing protein, partial [Lachnospiraceae bacterium]|nr:winged helix-turn-helix domain-containing protein [Lachnospiraceae bacterium]